MAFILEIKAEAHQDTINAYSYYEEKEAGLGERFLNALNETYQFIAKHPSHYGYIAEDPSKIFRDVRVKNFPYLVVYEIINDKVIVYAVFHARRDPDKKIEESYK